MTKKEFEDAVNRLRDRVPTLDRHNIIVELARIGARINDAHSGVSTLGDPEVNFRFYPVKLYVFEEGIFIRQAHATLGRIVGAKILKIGDTSINTAYKAVSELIPRDNEMTLMGLVPFLLAQSEVLHALGFIDDMENAEFTIEIHGKSQIVALTPMPYGSTNEYVRSNGWADARNQTATAIPLWLKEPNNWYWYEYIADKRAIYVQLNAIANKRSAEGKPQKTFQEFIQTVFEFVNANPVNRLILDLRMNGGGNSELNKTIIQEIIRSDKINRPGKLFIIIGRRTFSAAQNLVNEIEKYTSAIFVGEPTGARPNHYGDASKIILPNSGIAFSASTLWHQEAGPRDNRTWTAPHLAAGLTIDEYRTNNDPVISLIMNYRYDPLRDVTQLLMDAVSTKKYSIAEKRFRDVLNDPVYAYLTVEREVNTFGYQLLRRGQTEDAIEIFKINAKMYPNSANVHDSLGEAFFTAGMKNLAILSYTQSLKLDPSNGNAIEMLERLQAD
jgi:tetratricopeptide (TPR) repeat protein